MNKDDALNSSKSTGIFSGRLKSPRVTWKKLPIMKTAKGHAEKILKQKLPRQLGSSHRAGIEFKIKF